MPSQTQGLDRRPIIAGFTAPSRLRLLHRMAQQSPVRPRPQQVVHGDHAFRYCDYISSDKQPCGYWIMLRDPVERIISDYNYCVNRSGTWAQRLANWRDGRGDHLCSVTGLLHFNNDSHRPTLSEWVRSLVLSFVHCVSRPRRPVFILNFLCVCTVGKNSWKPRFSSTHSHGRSSSWSRVLFIRTCRVKFGPSCMQLYNDPPSTTD